MSLKISWKGVNILFLPSFIIQLYMFYYFFYQYDFPSFFAMYYCGNYANFPSVGLIKVFLLYVYHNFSQLLPVPFAHEV